MPTHSHSYLRDFLANNGPGHAPETPNVHITVANLKDQALLNRAFAKVSVRDNDVCFLAPCRGPINPACGGADFISPSHLSQAGVRLELLNEDPQEVDPATLKELEEIAVRTTRAARKLWLTSLPANRSSSVIS